MILTLGEVVSLLDDSGSMTSVALSETVVLLVIHAQVVVEGLLSVGWSVHGSQAT